MPFTLSVCSVTNCVAGDPCNLPNRTIVVHLREDTVAIMQANAPYFYSIHGSSGNVIVNAAPAVWSGGSQAIITTLVSNPGYGNTPINYLPADTYTITAWSTGDPTNILSAVTTIIDPSSVNEAIPTITNTSCNGTTGEIRIDFTGSIPDSWQLWTATGCTSVFSLLQSGSTPSNPLIISSLPIGGYSFHFMYSRLCTNWSPGYIATVHHYDYINLYQEITSGSLTLDITSSTTPELCGDSTGTITISLNNGTGPYTYLWSNGATTQNLTGLSTGYYTVTVTDASGCTGTATIYVDNDTTSIGCGEPVTCYKAVNCDPDCFGQRAYYLIGTDLHALLGFVINGLEIQGEVIDHDACWTIEVTDPSESIPPAAPCYNNLDIGNQSIIIDCSVTVDTTPIYSGDSSFASTTDFVDAIVNIFGLDLGFIPSSPGGTVISICAPDNTWIGSYLTISYKWWDGKEFTNVALTVPLTGPPGTGCYVAENFLGYDNAFSTCEKCKPIICETPEPFIRTVPEPVKIFYEIKESVCDITVTKKFANAYSAAVKKLKYGITDCCSGLDITRSWLDKQITDLNAILLPGYNCRSVGVTGCSWLPLQGCEILTTPYDGTSILAIAGEDLLYAKLVMLSNNGKLYLNDPSNDNNYQRAVGFTTMDVLANQSTRILITGTISNPLWTLTTGAIYFAAANGGITTAIPTTGISQAIGIAINPTTLLVELKQPNFLT